MRLRLYTPAVVSLLIVSCSDNARERNAEPENLLEEVRVVESKKQPEEPRAPGSEQLLEESHALESVELLVQQGFFQSEKLMEEHRAVDLARELEEERNAALEAERKKRLELQRTGGGERVIDRYKYGGTPNLHPSYDGQKKSEGYMLDNGNKVGFWTFWYQNGQKWKEGKYKNGEQEGVWSFWYPHGPKWKEETYQNGMWIKTARFENGKLVE